jgi:hypothetical protein
MKAVTMSLFIVLAGLLGRYTRSDENQPPKPGKEQAMSADLRKLEEELYRHGRAGFQRIREAHAKDTFYCFAFFTNGEFSYVAVTASTHEGLEKVAQQYKKQPRYRAMSIEDLRLDLKWSPCDSPLHGRAEDVLTPVDRLMEAISAELDRRFDLNDDQKAFDEFSLQLEDCFAKALRRIDTDGIFGRDAERKKVVVNLLMGDQSDEDRIGFAERVNPAESVEMLRQDLAAANRLRG